MPAALIAGKQGLFLERGFALQAVAPMLTRLREKLLEYHHQGVRVPRGERLVASLANHLGSVDSLLDVGCGDGAYTVGLARAIGADKVVGVDVHLRPAAQIEVVPYDGLHLPFPDQSFGAVTLIDVLHHCGDPLAVMREAIRVARVAVAIKDHFAFGPISEKVLYLMDLAGNARDHIHSPGAYFHPARWVSMITEAGGRIVALDWPLPIHAMPWRLVGWAELQFTMKVVSARQ